LQWLFGSNHPIYLDQFDHKRFRQLLTSGLFSSSSLKKLQQPISDVIRTHLAALPSLPVPFDIRAAFQLMTAAASLVAFCGPYITDSDSNTDDLIAFTNGLSCVPAFWPIPGSRLAKAIEAKKRLAAALQVFAQQSREYIKSGKSPRCVMDYYVRSIWLRDGIEGVEKADFAVGDQGVAVSMIDLMFAGQDASVSMLTFAVEVLEGNEAGREIAEIVRSFGDTAECDEYTEKVANLLLHRKPPISMVPHVALHDTLIPNTLIAISRGTYIALCLKAGGDACASVTAQDVRNHDADVNFTGSLTFGSGPRKCPGRYYAGTLLSLFVKIVCREFEFARVTERQEGFEMLNMPKISEERNMYEVSER
jgi:cytochrome P450